MSRILLGLNLIAAASICSTQASTILATISPYGGRPAIRHHAAVSAAPLPSRATASAAPVRLFRTSYVCRASSPAPAATTVAVAELP